jgi:hypothetical protein
MVATSKIVIRRVFLRLQDFVILALTSSGGSMKRVLSVLAIGLITLSGAGCRRSTAPLDGCVDVNGNFDPAAPGFIVSYQSGVDPVATTERLEIKYAFSAKYVYTVLPGFAAQLRSSALAGIRCERVVASIEHDAVGTIATR